MRLDARLGDHGWTCFDMDQCARVTAVVWVDDESATWGSPDESLTGRVALMFGERLTVTHHEKRIHILPVSRMVLFNPLPDADVRESEELPVLRDVVERKRIVLRNIIDPKQGQRA